MNEIKDWVIANWSVILLVASLLYNALAEFLANNPNIKANSPLNFMLILLGNILNRKSPVQQPTKTPEAPK